MLTYDVSDKITQAPRPAYVRFLTLAAETANFEIFGSHDLTDPFAVDPSGFQVNGHQMIVSRASVRDLSAAPGEVTAEEQAAKVGLQVAAKEFEFDPRQIAGRRAALQVDVMPGMSGLL